MAKVRTRQPFGSVRRLPSKRWQARYVGPDLARHNAPSTFDTKLDAQAWLSTRQTEISRGRWRRPGSEPRSLTFGAYSATWLSDRDLKPRTRELYAGLLERRILPTFADVPLSTITAPQVRRWHADQGAATPTARSHAYALLRTVLATAVTDELIPTNPAHLRGAGMAKRVKQIRPATLPELAALVEALPPRYRALTLIAAWCGLRFGEVVELRRGDVDLAGGVLRVRRAVVTMRGGRRVIGVPKSEAGLRDVAVPPHLLDVLRGHLDEHAQPGRNGLVFPAADGSSHLTHNAVYKVFTRAREAAGRPDLRFHDLRHTGAVLAAATGASLAELMARLGHSTPGAALRYQHAAQGRDAEIARALSALVER